MRPMDQVGMEGQPEPVDYETQINIAAGLGEREKKNIARMVIMTAEMDWQSSVEFRKARARWLSLFAGVLPEKPDGANALAQIHLPLIARAVLLFQAKLYSQLFPSTGAIYGASPTEPNDEERTARLERHINFQVRRKIPEYMPAHDRGLVQYLLYGSAFSVFYYNPIERRPCFEFVRTDDMILPYKCLSDRADLSDMPRITRRIWKYRHEVEDLVESGYYAADEKLLDKSAEAEQGNWGAGSGVSGTFLSAESSVGAVSDKIQGVSQNENDPDKPREFLEQDFLVKLPGEKRRRPVTAVVDRQNEVLVRLILRERDDPSDRARWSREMAARQAATEAQAAAFEREAMAWEQTMAYLSSPRTDEMGMPVPPTPQELLPAPPIPPQEPPMPASVRKVPWHRYTHYTCIRNPEGAYGLGLGFLIEGDNLAADAWASAIISLATLNVKPTFLYSRNASMQRGELELNLGEGIEVPLPPELLDKAFKQFEFPAPPAAAFKFIELFQQNAMEVGAPEVMGGEVSDRETATTTEIRASMAMQNLSTIAERYNRSRSNEVKVLAYINSQTLDDEEYFYVQGEPEKAVVGREDYIEDFDVTFTADPNLATQPQQERAAQRAIAVLAQTPPGTLDPESTIKVWRMALAQQFRAIGATKIADVIDKAKMPPAPGEENGTQPGDEPVAASAGGGEGPVRVEPNGQGMVQAPS